MNKPHRKRGYSLIEVLFAMAIFMLVMAGLLPYFIQSSTTLFKADAKLDANKTVRDISDYMINEARESNHFILYDSFKGSWKNGTFVDFRNSSNHGTGRLRDGESGKFLVLIYYGVDPYPADTTPAPIDRVIGLYLAVEEDNNQGAVKYFDIDVPVANQQDAIEDLIPAANTESNHDILVDEMIGLLDGDIFYNFKDRAILMNGQIVHGNDYKQITDTYNFTIAPRG